MTEERYEDDDFLFEEGDEQTGEGSLPPFRRFDGEADDRDLAADAEDDDLFLIEGLDVDESTAAPDLAPQAGQPGSPLQDLFVAGRAAAQSAPTAGSEEDVLFGEVPSGDGGNFAGADSGEPFHQGGEWAGQEVDLEELVGGASAAASGSTREPAPAGDEEEDLFQMEDVEVELVDGPQPAAPDVGSWPNLRPLSRDADADWTEHQQPSAEVEDGPVDVAPVFGVAPSWGDPEEQYGPPEAESVEIGAETWADEDLAELPPDHEDYDAIYGQESSVGDELEEQYYEEDWSDYEDEYVDETPEAPGLRVVGPGERRRSRLSVFASMAALLLVAAGGGTIAWLHPEWLGLAESPAMVSRVDVARPNLAPVLPAPTPPQITEPQPVEPAPEPPVVVEPTPEPPVVIEPTPPVEPELPVVVAEPLPTEPGTRQPAESLETLQFGDELEVHEAGPLALSNAPFPDLAIGTRAFAQLQNSEFFIGTVKKRDAAEVTLTLEEGEVSLAYASLRVLAPLGSADSGEVMEAENGFVRLTTDQRLYGTLIRTRKTDEVILRTADSRISVPARDIVDVGISKPGATTPVIDDEDDWLDARARERLLGAPLDSTPRNAARPRPAPPSRGR